jgi:dihydropyrimidinase
LRPREHRDALWRALAEGTLDVVSTDHGPRRRVADESGRLRHQSGTSGVEVRLPLMHDRGVLDGRIDLQRWVDVCCTAPARLHGLAQKGRLEPGRDADIVLFDPAARRRLSAGILHSAIDHSTYDGQDVRGWPIVTISRGQVIADRGEWLGEPRRGRFVRRSIG